MNHGLMSSHRIRTGWDKMVKFEKHPEQAHTPQELKEGLELHNWKIACNMCFAIMFVQIDMEGNSILMREGTCPIEECPICSEIHRVVQS